MEYKVTWTIELEADSPDDAAFKALEIQKDENSIAKNFTVEDEFGNKVEIELGSISLKFDEEEEPSGIDPIIDLLESLSDAESDEPTVNHAVDKGM